MKKILTNEKAFTLVEMMIVLLIISVLILITIPNVTKHSASIDEKGCKAFARMVEGQVEAYKIEKRTIPTLDDLVTEGFLKGDKTCPNGTPVLIDPNDGRVTIEGEETAGSTSDG